MKNQKIRSMKVHEQSGYNYKATPTIILKGQWLKEMGFEIGDYITRDIQQSLFSRIVLGFHSQVLKISKSLMKCCPRDFKILELQHSYL